MMVCPMLTWPSPPMATIPPLRTVRIVVACQLSGEEWSIIDLAVGVARDVSVDRQGCKRRRATARDVDPTQGCSDACSSFTTIGWIANFDATAAPRCGKAPGHLIKRRPFCRQRKGAYAQGLASAHHQGNRRRVLARSRWHRSV